MKNFKIAVNFNTEKSILIQKKLFEKGYCWNGGSTKIDYFPLRFMFFQFDETFQKKTLTAIKIMGEKTFKESELEEISFDLFILLSLKF